MDFRFGSVREITTGLVLGLCLLLHAGTISAKDWVGSDADWFNGANWSPAGVPGPLDAITIGPGENVILDPAAGTSSVRVAEIRVEDGALLTTLPGTILTLTGTLTIDGGFVHARDSEIDIDQLVIPPAPVGGFGFSSGGVRLNPTTKDQREILAPETFFTFTYGLGGTIAASPGNTGAGFYANDTAQDVTLNGLLRVELFHGFTPGLGDRFRILEASNSFTGAFLGLDEGDVVTRFGDVALTIAYDATGITLETTAAKVWTGSASANWFDPANWNPAGVPGAADIIAIGPGESVIIDPAVGGPNVSVAELLLEDGSLLTILPGTVLSVLGDILLDNGSIDARDSEITLDQLVIPPAPVGGYGFSSGGVRLNPTTKDQREILALNDQFTFTFGLGGTVAASPGNVGAGFYAAETAEDITLTGILAVELLHGFSPSVGQSFRILDASNSFTGRFVGLDDGDMAASFGNVALVIAYDATGVTLNAVAANAVPALSGWGLALMAILIGIAATLPLRRRSTNAY